VQGDPAELTDVPLFSSLSPGELESVARWSEKRHADPGVRLCGEGGAGYEFFVLRSGAAEVTKDGAAIRTLGAGDFFGELAFAGSGRRTATVTVTEPSELLVMYGTEFRRLEQECPGAAEGIRLAVAERTEPAA
jgi:CRP-like cAMP-binding protein